MSRETSSKILAPFRPVLFLLAIAAMAAVSPVAQASNPSVEDPITISVSGDSRSAIIKWSTNYPGTTQVEYGLTPGLGTFSDFDAQRVTRHEMELRGLTPGSRIFFEVISTMRDPRSGGDTTARSRTRMFRLDIPSRPTRIGIDFREPVGPYEVPMNGVVFTTHADPIQRAFYEENNHLINARRIFTPFNDTSPAWEASVDPQDRVMKMVGGSPVYNWDRVDALVDESLEMFDKHFVTIYGMPLAITATKVSGGTVSIQNGSIDVVGVGTNFIPEYTTDSYAIHFGNEDGTDNGDPFNQWYWIQDVQDAENMRLWWTYGGPDRNNIEYSIIRVNSGNGNRSTASDLNMYRDLVKNFALHLISRYGLNRVKDDFDFGFWNEPDVFCGRNEWFPEPNGCTDWMAFRRLYLAAQRGLFDAFSAHGTTPPSFGPASYASQPTEETEVVLDEPGAFASGLSCHLYGNQEWIHLLFLHGFQFQWDWGTPGFGQVWADRGLDWLGSERHLSEWGPDYYWDNMFTHLSRYSGAYVGFFQDLTTRLASSDPGKKLDAVYFHSEGLGNLDTGFGHFDSPNFYDGNTDKYIQRPSFNALQMINKPEGVRVRDYRLAGADPYIYALPVLDQTRELGYVMLGHWKSWHWYQADDGNSLHITDPTALRESYPVELFFLPGDVEKTKVYSLPSNTAYEYWRDVLGRKGDPGGSNTNPLTDADIDVLRTLDDVELITYPGKVTEFDVKPDSLIMVQYSDDRNFPPTAEIGLRQTAPNTLKLWGTQSVDVDGLVQNYAWDFGDGTQGNGDSLSHTFPGPGTYTIRLTITDDEGSTDTKTMNWTL